MASLEFSSRLLNFLFFKFWPAAGEPEVDTAFRLLSFFLVSLVETRLSLAGGGRDARDLSALSISKRKWECDFPEKNQFGLLGGDNKFIECKNSISIFFSNALNF